MVVADLTKKHQNFGEQTTSSQQDLGKVLNFSVTHFPVCKMGIILGTRIKLANN